MNYKFNNMKKLLLTLGIMFVTIASYSQIRPQVALAAGDTLEEITDSSWFRSYAIGADYSTEYVRLKPTLDPIEAKAERHTRPDDSE